MGQLDAIVVPCLVGIGAAFLAVAGIGLRKNSVIDEGNFASLSKGDYNRLVEKARTNWSSVSQNNRIYFGAFILSIAIQVFGQLSNHALLGKPLIVAMVYLTAFIPCLKNLVKGRLIDDQIVSFVTTGIKIEKQHPEWGDYFHKFVRDYHHEKFSMLSLAFFRVVMPSWLILSALRLAILERFLVNLPTWGASLSLVVVFGLASACLWKIGCQSYGFLLYQNKEVLA